MCVPLPHEQDTNSADTAYEIVCLRILDIRTIGTSGAIVWRYAPKRAHLFSQTESPRVDPEI
jgi:hypothetical protein